MCVPFMSEGMCFPSTRERHALPFKSEGETCVSPPRVGAKHVLPLMDDGEACVS